MFYGANEPPATTYIYALVDPSGEVRYIGKSDNPEKRHYAHVSMCRKYLRATRARCWVPSAKEHWIMWLIHEGKEPRLRTLEICPYSAWEEREEWWREYYLSRGHRLTNRKRNQGEDIINDHYYSVVWEWRANREWERISWTWEDYHKEVPKNPY